ncbi:hypothetical protein DP73_20130 [Desulfosporosinus sp. HMP52]|uniref:hypothetical protein n=1 Tax=Desulfosporosinus sp. HMP52 TaxID=1487923 RepID=UPI00051FB838|nr:hypothetical protein [Desulfosporosinus sp. HMP52]KGK82908.1 hypothetical protein DP73_20130 [Desulfosporosinus sp. HMP52]
MNDLQLFKKLLAYIFFSRPILKTERFNDIWWDLDGLRDYLAGPLYNIQTEGNCNYVYTDEEGRFPGVDSPEMFLKWCLDTVDKCRDILMKHQPENFNEEADFETIIRQIDGMEVLSHLAYRIESEQ